VSAEHGRPHRVDDDAGDGGAHALAGADAGQGSGDQRECGAVDGTV
jgi:hypothetical protein